MPIGAVIGGVLGLGGSLLSSSAASDAANATAAATKYAADLQNQQFQQTSNNMAPFLQGGGSAFGNLLNYYGVNPAGGGFSTPFNNPISAQVGPPPSPTDPRFTSLGGSSLSGAPQAGPAPSPTDPALREAFRASPGYDYLIRQMMDATQNSAAGRTGAISGNMLQALQRNAGGIADQDWWNFYNQDVNSWRNNFDAANTSWGNNSQNWWNVYNAIGANYGQQYQDIANQRNTITSVLGGLGATGQNAAANLGGFGQAAATSIGNAAITGANAQGAAKIAGANSFANAMPGVGNAITSLLNPNSGSGNGGLNYLIGGNQQASMGYTPSESIYQFDPSAAYGAGYGGAGFSGYGV